MTRDEYAAYLLEPHWRYIRAWKLHLQLYTCADCGYRKFPYKWGMPMGLEVHHLTYFRLGREKLADLLVLCEKCHATRHGKSHLGHVIGFWSLREILAGEAA